MTLFTIILAGSNDEGKDYMARRRCTSSRLVNGADSGAVPFYTLAAAYNRTTRLWEFKRSFGGKILPYSYMTLIADP